MTDIDQALAEIKRRAERTDVKLWWGADDYVECICIREDALREALAPLCEVVGAARRYCDAEKAHEEAAVRGGLLSMLYIALSATPSQEPTE